MRTVATSSRSSAWRLSAEAQVPLGQPLRHTQRVGQLQAQALALVEGAQDVAFQRLEAAGGPQTCPLVGVQGFLGLARLAAGDGEDRRLPAEHLAGIGRHKLDHVFDVIRRLQDVDLVHHEDDLLPPRANALDEGALAFAERAVDRGDKQDQVGARHEVLSDLLVPADHRVGARRVHDVDVAQPLRRVGHDHHLALTRGLAGLLAVLDEMDGRRGGGDAFDQETPAQQRVDERGFAGVELAHDDQQKQLVQLQQPAIQHRQIVGGGFQDGQRQAKAQQLAPLGSNKFFFGRVSRNAEA